MSAWENIRFTFPLPKVLFGKGALNDLPNVISDLLKPSNSLMPSSDITNPVVLFVIGSNSLKNSGKLDPIIENCTQQGINVSIFECGGGEASLEMVDQGVVFAQNLNPHFIVGIGGGTVLDTAKSIAGIITNGGTTQDYHDGKKFEKPGIPFIAVPTTAGTGSEITNNAVLIDFNRGFKQSIRGENLVAKCILLDPELTLSCPPTVTADSGADALVQAIEAYVSKNSNALTDIYAIQAIDLIAHNLKQAYENGADYDARAQMLLGSFLGGIAFSNAGLGLVHGLAHPLGFKYQIPHGKICAALLPWVIEYNSKERASKYAKIAKLLGDLDLPYSYSKDATDEENTEQLINLITEFFSQLNIPHHLQEMGVQSEDFEWIIANTKGGSVNANIRVPDPESLQQLLKKAF
jgi:alcohol dehydrogenase class IV